MILDKNLDKHVYMVQLGNKIKLKIKKLLQLIDIKKQNIIEEAAFFKILELNHIKLLTQDKIEIIKQCKVISSSGPGHISGSVMIDFVKALQLLSIDWENSEEVEINPSNLNWIFKNKQSPKIYIFDKMKYKSVTSTPREFQSVFQKQNRPLLKNNLIDMLSNNSKEQKEQNEEFKSYSRISPKSNNMDLLDMKNKNDKQSLDKISKRNSQLIQMDQNSKNEIQNLQNQHLRRNSYLDQNLSKSFFCQTYKNSSIQNSQKKDFFVNQATQNQKETKSNFQKIRNKFQKLSLTSLQTFQNNQNQIQKEQNSGTIFNNQDQQQKQQFIDDSKFNMDIISYDQNEISFQIKKEGKKQFKNISKNQSDVRNMYKVTEKKKLLKQNLDQIKSQQPANIKNIVSSFESTDIPKKNQIFEDFDQDLKNEKPYVSKQSNIQKILKSIKDQNVNYNNLIQLKNTLFESPFLEEQHLLPLQEWKQILKNENQIFDQKTDDLILSELLENGKINLQIFSEILDQLFNLPIQPQGKIISNDSQNITKIMNTFQISLPQQIEKENGSVEKILNFFILKLNSKFKSCQEAFKYFDAYQNNQVSMNQFKGCLDELKIKLQFNISELLFKWIDRESKGYITFGDLWQVYEEHRKNKQDQNFQSDKKENAFDEILGYLKNLEIKELEDIHQNMPKSNLFKRTKQQKNHFISPELKELQQVKKFQMKHEQDDKIKDLLNGNYLRFQLSNQIAKSTLEKVNLQKNALYRIQKNLRIRARPQSVNNLNFKDKSNNKQDSLSKIDAILFNKDQIEEQILPTNKNNLKQILQKDNISPFSNEFEQNNQKRAVSQLEQRNVRMFNTLQEKQNNLQGWISSQTKNKQQELLTLKTNNQSQQAQNPIIRFEIEKNQNENHSNQNLIIRKEQSPWNQTLNQIHRMRLKSLEKQIKDNHVIKPISPVYSPTNMNLIALEEYYKSKKKLNRF